MDWLAQLAGPPEKCLIHRQVRSGSSPQGLGHVLSGLCQTLLVPAYNCQARTEGPFTFQMRSAASDLVNSFERASGEARGSGPGERDKGQARGGHSKGGGWSVWTTASQATKYPRITTCWLLSRRLVHARRRRTPQAERRWKSDEQPATWVLSTLPTSTSSKSATKANVLMLVRQTHADGPTAFDLYVQQHLLVGVVM